MTQFSLSTTSGTKIASAGTTVEVQGLSINGVQLAFSATLPSVDADGEVLSGSDPYRKYDTPLPLDLYARALYAAPTSVEVQPIGASGGTSGGAITIGSQGTAGDTMITTGGRAQALFAGTIPSNGFSVANPDLSEDLWISDSTTAAPNASGSLRVPASALYETPPAYKPAGPVSVLGATTGHAITARRW